MIPIRDNDNNYSCLTPLCFLEAFRNLSEALKLLAKVSTSVDAVGPPTALSTNHTVEYEKHLDFFRQIEDFKDSYHLWYKFEQKACLKILMANVVFNWSKYASYVNIILQSHHTLLENQMQNYTYKFLKTGNASNITIQCGFQKTSPLFFEISH